MKSIAIALLSCCIACSASGSAERTTNPGVRDGGTDGSRTDAPRSVDEDGDDSARTVPLEHGIDGDVDRALERMCTAARESHCLAQSSCCGAPGGPCELPLDECKRVERVDAAYFFAHEAGAVDLAGLRRCVAAHATQAAQCGVDPYAVRDARRAVFDAVDVELDQTCRHGGVCADGAGYCDCSIGTPEAPIPPCEARCEPLPREGELCFTPQISGQSHCATGLVCDPTTFRCVPERDRPSVAYDGSCRDDGQCRVGERCDGTRCVAVPAGTSCSRDAECGHASTCGAPGFRCQSPLRIGEPCSFTGCERGSYCSTDAVCARLTREGEPCAGSAICAEGLACVHIGDTFDTRCQRPAPRGARCDQEAQQPLHPVCEEGAACVDGVCVDAPDIGAACRNAAGCASGLTCRDGLCAEPASHGDACSSTYECAPGLICDRDVCQPPLAHGAGCPANPNEPSPCADSADVCVDKAADGSTCAPSICLESFPRELWYEE